MVRLLASIAVVGAFCGCASVPSEQARSVVVVEQNVVAGCKEIGEYQYGSMLSAVPTLAGKGHQNAQVQVLERAAQEGATHLVWQAKTGLDSGTPGAKGKAYKCDRVNLGVFSVPVPDGEKWKPAGDQTANDYCRKLDAKNPHGTVCFMFSSGSVADVSHNVKSAKDYFAVVEKLKTIDADTGRMQSIKNSFKPISFRNRECLEADQLSRDVRFSEAAKEDFHFRMLSRNCYLKGVPDKWVEVSVSIRYRANDSPRPEFGKEELGLLENLKF
jgi:hypothetical protein